MLLNVHFSNLGCKLNQAEIEGLARQFHHAGFSVVSTLDDAQFHVVNSCTVTHLAARDSRKTARRGARLGTGIRTVLTGCYATEAEAEAAGLEGVDLVVSNDRKHDLLNLFLDAFPEACPEPRLEEGMDVSYVPLVFGNTRAALKVEDGCNMRCSFCIIPYTRGRQQSRTVSSVVDEMQSLVASGVREVVVTGVQISAYRSGDDRLADLTDALLQQTDIERLRLTSIAPWQFDERLFALLREERVCRHVHLSLQSGCDETLVRMRRPYSSSQFRGLADRLRTEVPGIAITTDVIVGFPGETDGEFEQSLNFVGDLGFARSHVFTYSVREGTLAADLPDQVEYQLKKERTRRLLEVAKVGEEDFNRSQIGETVSVLWEDVREGVLRGTSDNYLRVRWNPEESPSSTEDGVSLASARPEPGHTSQVQVLACGEAPSAVYGGSGHGVMGVPITGVAGASESVHRLVRLG